MTLAEINLAQNWLLIEFDKNEFDRQVAELKNGIRIDKRFEKNEYAVVFGKIAKVCSELYYLDNKGELSEAPLEFDTPIEVKEGDECYYNFLSAENAVRAGRTIKIEHKNYIFIRYDRLYAIIRNGEWLGVNGWKVIQPTSVNPKQGLFKLPVKQQNEGIVLSEGCSVRHYWDKRYKETGFLRKGDVVRYLHATPIENNLLKVKDINYLRIQERDILYRNNFEMSDYTFHVKPLEYVKGLMKIREKTMCKGVVTHAPSKWKDMEGTEIMYHKESEVIESGETFVTRVGDVADVKGVKFLVGL